MNQETNQQSVQEEQPENYDVPNIEGEIDTVAEEIEHLEKRRKVPVWIWIVLIIIISILTFYITSNQSPTIII